MRRVAGASLRGQSAWPSDFANTAKAESSFFTGFIRGNTMTAVIVFSLVLQAFSHFRVRNCKVSHQNTVLRLIWAPNGKGPSVRAIRIIYQAVQGHIACPFCSKPMRCTHANGPPPGTSENNGETCVSASPPPPPKGGSYIFLKNFFIFPKPLKNL